MSQWMNADSYVGVLADEVYRIFAFRAQSQEEAGAWQRAFRPKLRRLLGLDAIAARGPAPMTARMVDSEKLADHVREEWRLETEPGFELPFYLLKPLQQTGPLPVVITPHGHGKAGKKTYVGIYESKAERQQGEEGQRDIALQAVRAGYLAIAPDMRGFAGLRRSEEIEEDANNSCRHLQMHAYLFGRTLIGERVWDVQRLIDWAQERDDVDPQGVVVTGNSGGGTVTLFTGAVDQRVRVTIPGSYFCTFEHSIGSIRHCECNYVPGILQAGEMYDVAGLIAPRPFLAVAGVEDSIFPIAAVRESYARLQSVYGTFGAADWCRLSVGEGGHRYYSKDVWPFVREALAACRE